MIKEKMNWLDQQRVDVPHLKRMQNSIVSDFSTLLNFFTANQPYILAGFNIANANSLVGQSPNNVQVIVDGAKVWMPNFSDGSFLEVPVGSPNELLLSSNSKVIGSFTANAVNYISLQFVRAADSSTNDLVKFYDVDAKSEIAKTVPLGLVLGYQFVINTTGFSTNSPIAKITMGATTITSIENCKNSLFRLGTGGNTPDPNHNNTLAQEIENSLITLGATDPFLGGDWELRSLKSWMDHVMTRIKKLGGSPYWYTDQASLSNLNLLDTWHDANGSVITGSGRFKHSQLLPGDFSWTSPIVIKSIVGPREYTVAAGGVTLADNEVAYITLNRNIEFDNANDYSFTAGSVTVTCSGTISGIVSGSWIKSITHDESAWRQISSIIGNTITLMTAYPTTVISKAVKSQASYSMQQALPENVPANSSTYWLAKRDYVSPVSFGITAVSRTSNLTTVTTGAINQFVEGQAVYISAVSDPTFDGIFEIVTILSSTQFTVRNNGVDATSSGGAVVAAARIYLRGLGELAQGEELQIDGQISSDTIAYVGAKSEVDNSPDYTAITIGSNNLPSFNTVIQENLTSRLSKVTAMHADRWQDDNIVLVSGNVTFNPSDASPSITVQNAYLKIPGVGNVQINSYTGTLELNECLYVDFSRSSNAALTLAKGIYDLIAPTNNRKICFFVYAGPTLFDANGVVDLHSDKLYKVDFVDPVSTSVPGVANPVIDGVAVQSGNTVLFTNLTTPEDIYNNQVHIANSSGILVAGNVVKMFHASGSDGLSVSPADGSSILVRKGNGYANSLGTFNTNYWDFNDVVRHFSSNGNYFEQSSLKSASIANNATTVVFSIPLLGNNNILIDYAIVRGINKEAGQLVITHDGTSATLANYSATLSPTGITFASVINGSNIEFQTIADNSTTGTISYSVKRWSDIPGGPAGIVGYNAINTLNNGVINSAFAMSDASGIEVGCNAPTVVLGKTQLQLLWAYVQDVNYGSTAGDLEVIVNGQVFPRLVDGTTLDGYYKEIDAYTIEFHTDLSVSPVSIEVRKKYGTYDFSSVNANRMRRIYDVIVGSSAQVLAGEADYSNINTAITNATAGSKILILQGTYVENINVSKELMIEGKGLGTIISGTFTVGASADGSIVKYLKVTGNITITGDSCIMTEMWKSSGATVTSSPNSYYLIIDN